MSPKKRSTSSFCDVRCAITSLWPSSDSNFAPLRLNTHEEDILLRASGIILVLSLGNTWSAYRSPEEMMKIAGLDPSGKTLLDYYSSPQVASLYMSHINAIVTRSNTISGLTYSSDPTIMMWDLINEPRCPGCTEPSTQAIVKGWIERMSSYLKSNAPNQLVSPGTEGYFMNDVAGDSSDVRWNPGAGSMCEGEDWRAIGALSSVDVLVGHFYARQMESVPPSWLPCDWTCFSTFLPQYISQHRTTAENIGKPFIIEEFGLLLQTSSEAERAATFRQVYDALVQSKNKGGGLAGAMFWSAATGEISDDGYNVYLDEGQYLNPTPTPSSSSSSSQQPVAIPVRAPILDNREGLDGFRMGGARAACADEAAKWWQPLWYPNSSSPSATQSSITDSLLSRTKGMSTQAVIAQAAKDIGVL